jgi:Family of unknown function (DUF6206)
MGNIEIDVEILKDFERGLDPRRPERSEVPARVLGYGEISTVFEIDVEGMEGYAFKRLPIFESRGEVDIYRTIYEEYNRLLEEEVGIAMPAYGYAEFVSDSGRPIFFIIQEKLSAPSIGNRAIHELTTGDTVALVRAILGEMRRIWRYNAGQDRVEITVDGQISNWSIVDYDAMKPSVSEGCHLLYVDTSTPLFRVEGVEQLNPELFLRSAPSFAAWILKRLFLADVVNRYYDPRRVTLDLIANFFKEQRPELIPDLVETANRFFGDEAAFLGVEPIREKDVRSYYREDALIWVLYLNARRIDRFLRTQLLRREYPYILPGKIKR